MKSLVNGSIEAHPEATLMIELVGGEPYEYYPLGDHIVRTIGVCGGRLTFKYTRIDFDEQLHSRTGCRLRSHADNVWKSNGHDRLRQQVCFGPLKER